MDGKQVGKIDKINKAVHYKNQGGKDKQMEWMGWVQKPPITPFFLFFFFFFLPF